MKDENSSLNIWKFIERLKIVLDLIATIIVVAPILLSTWLLLQNGLNAVIPAWLILVTAIFASLLGYWFGIKTLFNLHKVIYDGRRGMSGFDFTGKDSSIPNDESNDIGYGNLQFEDGVLILERKNMGGRYEIHLTSYTYKGKKQEVIPANPHISGNRELRVSFDVKVSKGQHTVDFVIKTKNSDRWLDHRPEWISKDKWTHYDYSFKVTAADDLWLRIDDRAVSEIGSRLYIKNLVLTEI